MRVLLARKEVTEMRSRKPLSPVVVRKGQGVDPDPSTLAAMPRAYHMPCSVTIVRRPACRAGHRGGTSRQSSPRCGTAAGQPRRAGSPCAGTR